MPQARSLGYVTLSPISDLSLRRAAAAALKRDTKIQAEPPLYTPDGRIAWFGSDSQ
jgi:hypothetical protein